MSYKRNGYHVCEGCGETVYCQDDDCKRLPDDLCDECYLIRHYKHEKKTSQ